MVLTAPVSTRSGGVVADEFVGESVEFGSCGVVWAVIYIAWLPLTAASTEGRKSKRNGNLNEATIVLVAVT